MTKIVKFARKIYFHKEHLSFYFGSAFAQLYNFINLSYPKQTLKVYHIWISEINENNCLVNSGKLKMFGHSVKLSLLLCMLYECSTGMEQKRYVTLIFILA